MRFMKSQEGLIIAGFALATVMIIALLVTYLSNRVVDMIAIQSQVFFSKQAYWNAYSGMEIATSKKIASLDGIPNAEVSFATGTITITPTTEPNTYLGGNKVTDISSLGSDAGGRSREMELEIGTPNPSSYALFFDGSFGDFVNIGTIEEKMEMQLSCFEDVGGHTTEALCDAGKAAHSDNATGHFNKIEYADDDVQADFSISLWVRPDYSEMGNNYGVIFAANNCVEVGHSECNNERGIVLGVRRDNYYLRIWHTSDAQVDFETYEVSGEPAPLSADSWHHVVYTRSAALGSEVGKIYLNGVLLGTEDPDDSWFKDADDGELWYLGTDIDTGPVKSQNYAGCMDEVAIWRKVLSLAEIQSLYIQGMSFDIAANMSTELVAHWNFDGDGDVDVSDLLLVIANWG